MKETFDAINNLRTEVRKNTNLSEKDKIKLRKVVNQRARDFQTAAKLLKNGVVKKKV